MRDLEKGVEGPVPSHEHSVDGERVSEKAQAYGFSQRLCEGV